MLLGRPIPAPLIAATDILVNTQGSGSSVADKVILVLVVMLLKPLLI